MPKTSRYFDFDNGDVDPVPEGGGVGKVVGFGLGDGDGRVGGNDGFGGTVG